MKKYITLLLMIAIGNHFAKGQTVINGVINNNIHWTLAGSPYIIAGVTQVNSNHTLTIDAGVTVKFDSAACLLISGNMKAIGNSSNRILFTSNKSTPAPGDWGYILFNNQSAIYNINNPGSIMQYCVVEYSGDTSVSSSIAAIKLSGAYPVIDKCEIRNNACTGISYVKQSVTIPTDSIKITNCNIHHNTSPVASGGIDIHAPGFATTIVSGNVIDNNRSGIYTGGGIYCFGKFNSLISNNLITNNFFADSISGLGGGVYANCNFLYNIVWNNSASFGGGIYMAGSSLTINNNIIANNKSVSSGSVYMYNCTNHIFSHNSIIDNNAENHCAIRCYGMPNDISSIDYNTITRNQSTGNMQTESIYFKGASFKNNNCFNNNSIFEFSNANIIPYNVDATNCWWGTASSNLISGKIYDNVQNATLSNTNHYPILQSVDTLAPVTPPTGFSKKDIGNGNIELSWKANPESDLEGYKIYFGSFNGYSFSTVLNVGNVTTYVLSGVSLSDSIGITAYDKQNSGIKDQLYGHESWYTIAREKPEIDFSSTTNTVCAGDTVYFSDLTTGSNSWHWYFPGSVSTVDSVQNPAVVYSNGGTYDIGLVITNNFGRDSITFTNYITVNAMPQVSLTLFNTICKNNSAVNLSGGIPVGGVYSGLGVEGDSFDPETAGVGLQTITYTYADSNGCGETSVSQDIEVLNSPAVGILSSGPVTFCMGGFVNLTVDSTMYCSGCDYLWNTGSADTTIIADTSGYYMLTASNGTCSSKDSILVSVESCTGINLFSTVHNVNVYPNPFSSNATISMPQELFQTGSVTIKVYDVSGREMVSMNNINTSSVTLNRGNLLSGIYIYKIYSNNKSINTGKLFVE